MGKFDGILSAFKINNDDDDYEDDYDGYDDPEYEAPAKPSKSSRKNADSSASDDYENEPKKIGKSFWTSGKSNSKNNSKKGTENMEVSIYYPKSLDAATTIVDSLLEQKSVIMNLEGIEMDLAQRIFDLITGATYALDGRLEKISKYVYVVTPSNVNISGDNNSDESSVSIGKDFPV